MTAIVDLLRARQWIKNIFVLAPLFFSSELFDKSALLRAGVVFVIFCLLSSAVYILNDWCDLDADRQHSKKKLRALPSGKISLLTAFLILGALITTVLVLVLMTGLSAKMAVVLGVYIGLNVSYSLGLKQVSVVELFIVASGFVLRLLAGGVALEIELSPWIILATGLLAMLIVIGKRRGDIAQGNDLRMSRKVLAAYNLVYLDAMLATFSGGTIVAYLLFCVSDYAVGRFGPNVMLTAVPVAIGIMRYVQLVMVEAGGDSPTDMLIYDRSIVLIVVIFLLMFGFLIYR
jgi:decaprenyl-phosphate phosphoribosyltransferase